MCPAVRPRTHPSPSRNLLLAARLSHWIRVLFSTHARTRMRICQTQGSERLCGIGRVNAGLRSSPADGSHQHKQAASGALHRPSPSMVSRVERRAEPAVAITSNEAVESQPLAPACY